MQVEMSSVTHFACPHPTHYSQKFSFLNCERDSFKRGLYGLFGPSEIGIFDG